MPERTSGEIIIDAPPDAVMEVIADLPAYPQWSDGMEEVEVLESYSDGRPKRAKFLFNPGPIADEFVLDYQWNGSRSVSWVLTEGTVVKAQEGTYTLAEQSDGSVLVTYELMVELSIPMIGKIRSRAEKMIVKTALAGLKKRVENPGNEDEENREGV
jgi:ribosome-associated toxin RatA of RatAB toxin-antitoxin module